MTAPEQTPSMRLLLSRAMLRQALQQSASHGNSAGRSPAGSTPDGRGGGEPEPVTRALLDALGPWWARNPLRTQAAMVGQSARTLVTPCAQRHPFGLVATAFAAGGWIAWARPWRWAPLPALVEWLPQMAGKVAAQIPPSTWLELIRARQQQEIPPGE